MRMKKVLLIMTFAAACIAFDSPASYAQSSADLDFTYSGETGVIRITQTLNRKPSAYCHIRLRGSISYEGSAQAEEVRTIGFLKDRREKVTQLTINKLPAVQMSDTDANPILTLQTRTVCGTGNKQKTVVSNATARYVVCGRGTEEVTPRGFLRTLSNRFDAAAN